MKAGLHFFGQIGADNVPAAVPAMFRMHEMIVHTLAPLLRAFGIREVVLTLIPAGPVPISKKQFAAFDMDAPAEVVAARPEIVAVLIGLMERFGVHDLSIDLSEAEKQELKDYWKFLDSGDVHALENLKFKDLPLKYETDPHESQNSKEDHQQQDQEPGQAEVQPAPVGQSTDSSTEKITPASPETESKGAN